MSAIEPRVEGQSPERGATSVEYALMASLIAIVIIAAVKFFGTSVSSLFDLAAHAF